MNVFLKERKKGVSEKTYKTFMFLRLDSACLWMFIRMFLDISLINKKQTELLKQENIYSRISIPYPGDHEQSIEPGVKILWAEWAQIFSFMLTVSWRLGSREAHIVKL